MSAQKHIPVTYEPQTYSDLQKLVVSLEAHMLSLKSKVVALKTVIDTLEDIIKNDAEMQERNLYANV